MSEAAAATRAGPLVARAGLSVRALCAAILGLFAADNILLLHFWGLPLAATAGLTFVAGSAIWILCGRIRDVPRVPWSTFALALAFSVALFALGGEGRFFYANVDWQIRDAVLRDMASNPWPFAYDLKGTPSFLRAPVGMYLFPAMFGASAELALLVSNALRLALLLTVGSCLFERKRDQAIALAVFLLFSGWDIVGTAFDALLGGHPGWDHLERWNFSLQYSSNVTQAFWVPHHAIAGWTCALAFMLWRKGIAPIGMFAAAIPLVAIWSPLAIMGAVPFAALAGIQVLPKRAFDPSDIILAGVGLLIAVPSLLYLQIDAESVSTRLLLPPLAVWTLCIALEVAPFAWPLVRESEAPARDRSLVALVVALLVLMPVLRIGANTDFQMRASIMPLAILAVLFAQWMCRLVAAKPRRTMALVYAIAAVGLGAATPLFEIHRAVVNDPSPAPLCSLVGVWDKEDGMPVPHSTYFAPTSKLPSALGDVPMVAGHSDPEKCWDGKWLVV